uniref:Uncharacterized protein n=1 Tax=Pithovirus LCDPAC02 TaxID=2506601 RepID=A0A481YNE5_9VIRU|nr:MAG: hypothetical protein LCDPAC02_00620 [Pithovirus LCDPAC02]
MFPKIIVEKYKIDKKNVYVFNDHRLDGGTKGRVALEFLEITIEEYLIKHKKYPICIDYIGPRYGMAQVALSFAVLDYKEKYNTDLTFRSFTQWKTGKDTEEMKMVLENEGEIYRIDRYGKDRKETNEKDKPGWKKNTEEYYNKNVQSNKYILVPFGGRNDLYMDLLYENIERSLKDVNFCKDFVNNIWVTAGSGTLLNVLFQVFPNAHFNVMVPGMKIYPDQLEKIHWKNKLPWKEYSNNLNKGYKPQLDHVYLYINNYHFVKDKYLKYVKDYKLDQYWVAHDFETIKTGSKKFAWNEDKKHLPPYESSLFYDSKMWKYIKKYGEDGDYIWNVY